MLTRPNATTTTEPGAYTSIVIQNPDDENDRQILYRLYYPVLYNSPYYGLNSLVPRSDRLNITDADLSSICPAEQIENLRP